MLPEFGKAGYAIAALSVDDEVRSRTVEGSLHLTFPLLCDPARKLVESWKLLNREEKGGIAFPALFVLAPDRTVRFWQLEGVRSRIAPQDALKLIGPGSEKPAPGLKPVSPGMRGLFGALSNLVRHGLKTPWRKE